MGLSPFALLHPPSALRAVRGSRVACRQILRQRTGPAAQTRRLIWWACRGKHVRFRVPDVGLNGLHRLTHLRELNGNHLIVRFPNGGRWVVRGKLTAQGELVPEALEGGRPGGVDFIVGRGLQLYFPFGNIPFRSNSVNHASVVSSLTGAPEG